MPCCSWLLGAEEPCPALSNWCFALIPLAGLRPELARWLQRAAVNPVTHLWVLERINLLAVQAFKGGNLLVLNRQNARLSALGTGRSRFIGHRRFEDENTSVPPIYQSVGVPAKSFNLSERSRRSSPTCPDHPDFKISPARRSVVRRAYNCCARHQRTTGDEWPL